MTTSIIRGLSDSEAAIEVIQIIAQFTQPDRNHHLDISSLSEVFDYILVMMEDTRKEVTKQELSNLEGTLALLSAKISRHYTVTEDK